MTAPIKQFIEKLVKDFEEKFSRTDSQTGKIKPKWFFPEITSPRDVSNFLRQALTDIDSLWRERVKRIVPEKLTRNEAELNGLPDNDYINGFNLCRDQILKNLEEL